MLSGRRTLERTGEVQQIRSTTKRIICLSECLAVSSAKVYWFFSCFICVSRGKAGEREDKIEQVVLLFVVLTPLKNSLSLRLDICFLFIQHSHKCKKKKFSMSFDINIYTVNYYMLISLKMCLDVCTFRI